MNNLTAFRFLCDLLERQKEILFAPECLAAIDTEIVLFDVLETKSRELSFIDMKTHYEIKVHVTGAKIEGYLDVLGSLNKCVDDSVTECVLTSEKYLYIVLVSSTFSNLVGILRSSHSNTNILYCKIQEMIRRGIKSSSIKVHARREIEW